MKKETEHYKQEGGAVGPSYSCFPTILQLPREAVEKAACMDDFYRAAGLAARFESGEVKDVRQVWMNRGQCDELLAALHRNARRDKRWRFLSDHHLQTSIGMDYLCYAPVSVAYVPYGLLWLWSKDDTEAAMEEYCRWHRDIYHQDG